TGNRLADLPDWLRLCAHVAGSFTAAMALEAPGRAYEYAEIALVVLLSLAAVVLRARPLGRERAAALIVIWLAWSFAYVKEGFVRHDEHALLAFSALGAGLLAYRWSGT